MKTIRDFDLKNKRVLLRCDFNVPLNEKGEILNDFRIKAALPTIEYLIKAGAKIILISHLAEPERQDKRYSLKPVAQRLEELLRQKIEFVEGAIPGIAPCGEVVLLENLRFHKGEKENNEEFAKELAGLADIYINDAFGVCHREHASVAAITKFLASGAGFLLEKEIEALSQSLNQPERPLVAIIGGKKIETKIKVIDQFLKKADCLLLGGKIGLEANIKSDKLVVPLDDKEGLDIGPKSIKAFSEIIKKARTIIWNGPMGKFEDKRFEKGTKEIAKAIAKNKKAFKIAGGGETIEAIFKYGLENKFNHISTGGGAMLAFLSDEKLPGIETLK